MLFWGIDGAKSYWQWKIESLMQSEPVIAINNLSKHYGNIRAVDNVNLNVYRGEIYGFLGLNGAGKTTTIRMLLGLIAPSLGGASIFGTRIKPGEQSIFSRVGFIVESSTAYPNLTVRENLDIQRCLTRSQDKSVSEIIELMGLGAYADRRAAHLSLGNKQRLSLARALLHRPELLILDEPANALDPAGIIEIRNLLRNLAKDHGVTIFLSSHILVEVAHLADRIGIVHKGKLIEDISQDELRAKSRPFLDIVVSNPVRAAKLLSDHLGIHQIEEGGRVEGNLRIFDRLDHVAEIAKTLVGNGHDLMHLCITQEDLEEQFMRIIEGEAQC